MDFARNVFFHAKLNPQRPALAYVGGVATYDMLGRGVVTVCAFLARNGIARGSVVAIDVRNPLHHVALILGLEISGATSVSLHTHLNAALARLAVDAVLVDQYATPLPGVRVVTINDEWFALAAKLDVDFADIAPSQYYRIILSSGTTGVPKAIGYTPAAARELLSRQTLLVAEGSSASLSMLGLSTIGFFDTILSLITGRLACFASSPKEVLSIIRVFSVSRLAATTGQVAALLDSMEGSADPFPSLRLVMIGGSKMSRELAAEARARLCQNIIFGYGSTEAGLISWTRVGFGDPPEGAAGYLQPWVEAEAFSTDGVKLPRGQDGMIHVKTSEMAEYVDDAGTPKLSPDQWFHTGDIGYVREDDLLVIKGRSSEVLNRGGAIIAPEQIEKVVESHRTVTQAAAFAMSNSRGIDEIWVAVVADRSFHADSVMKHARDRLGDKSPNRLVVVDALPRTENGKLMRGALKARFSGDR